MSTVVTHEGTRLVVGEVSDRLSNYRHADHDEETCQSSWEGWWCTRPVDHPGIHEAGTFIAGRTSRVVASWSR